ncbi:hypothetical protein FRB97_003140, partial [Tulasnella sp. 331]
MNDSTAIDPCVLSTDAESNLPNNKDSDFYFPDGNIILAVGCGRHDECLFRVLKSQLAKSSEFFRDMFSLPQPDGAGSEMLDDCCVLRLDDETASIRNTFRLLWDIPPYHPTFDALLGMLRVSQKYIMSAVNAWSLFQLKIIFPSEAAQLFAPNHFSRWRRGQNAVKLILASGRHNASEFLPYAYFALATSNWATRIDATKLGIDRLTTDQVMMLGVARAFLQEKLSEKLLSNNRDCIGFPDPGYVCKNRECSKSYSRERLDESLQTYIRQQDLMLWIKDTKEDVLAGASNL